MSALTLPDIATRINAEHAAAEQAARSALEHAFACGRLLTEAKARIEHGQWIPWLEANVTVTPRTAQRYMVLAEKCDTVSHLTGVREALEYLAEPKADDTRQLPSDGDSWSTPPWILDAARTAMGAIDLDPATNQTAIDRVGAVRHYTAEDDGLSRPWSGRVWCNPPYSNPAPWVDKVIAEREAGRVAEAIVLLPELRSARWAGRMLATAAAVWFPVRRVAFVNPETGQEMSGNSWGTVGAYYGEQPARFIATFREIGYVLLPSGGAS